MKRMWTKKVIGEVAVDSVQDALDSKTLHIVTNVLSFQIGPDDLDNSTIVNAEIKEKLNTINEGVIVGYGDTSGDIFIGASTSIGGGIIAFCLGGGSVMIRPAVGGLWDLVYNTDTYPSIGDVFDDLGVLDIDIKYIP